MQLYFEVVLERTGNTGIAVQAFQTAFKMRGFWNVKSQNTG